ncbi:MAG: HAMP domain-containing histidine kinase [Chloroflexota bacterium]
MKWRRWLPIFAPALLGLAVSLWLNFASSSNPIIYMRVDAGTLIFLFSLGICLLAGIILALWDRDEKFRLNTNLRTAEDRRRFLRRLDHELKNPLTAILAGLANLTSITSTETQRTPLKSVEAQVHRLRDLVSNLRKLSDLEFRQLEYRPVDLSELLTDIVALSKERLTDEERLLTLSIPQAPWPLPMISGDGDLLILAIHNLIDNALKFTGVGDTVEVRAIEDDNAVVIEVADTGPGIPAAELSQVWEELYRGETARGTPGSGLGLALVRRIVYLHGGEVSVRSRPGQGTVFSVRLPIGDTAKR